MLKLTLLCLLPLVLCEKFRFDNYTLYNTLPKGENQLRLLRDLENTDVRFDFWNSAIPSATFVSILSSPENKSYLESFLRDNGINYEVTMSNIQDAIDKEHVQAYTRNNIRSMLWNAYYKLDDIYSWMDDIARANPTNVSVIIGGVSYEGREIKGLKISHGPDRRAIFLEGGIHSREWISPATVCYITHQLLESTDEETQAAARGFDWYIFPVTNPDGYIWTHESFRMWRKNRRPQAQNAIGVDLNRNWDNNWLVHGASTNPASDTFAGTAPFSEPETISLSSFIRTIGDKIDLYLSFHSFGQLLLLPFGNTTEPVGNYHDAMNIGRRAMGALSVRYGTQYTTGNIAEAIYLATGGSIDWVKEELNVPLVYCYELRANRTYGFLLPEDQILPNNQETMDSVIDIIHQANRFGYMNPYTDEEKNSGILQANCLKKSFVLIIIAIISILNY